MSVVRDTGIVFRRYLMQLLHNPAWVIIGLLQPIMYLVLFAPLLKQFSSAGQFGPDGTYNFFVPGLIVQLGLFGASGVGFGLISELRLGVIERMRVTPISRVSMLLGRGLRDVVMICTQAALLIAVSVPFGLKLHIGGVLLALVLLALIGLMTASLSYTVALAVKSEDVFAPIVFTVTLPLLLLSGVLLPISDAAPGWLRGIAAANPLKYAVDAAREAFRNGFDSTVWVGFGVIGMLCALSVVIAARAFGRAVA